MPLVSRTRATLRSAEFGFFGVVVYTRVQTPRFCGDPCRAGAACFARCFSRPRFTSWLIVGIELKRVLRESETRLFIWPGHGCQPGYPHATASGVSPGGGSSSAPPSGSSVTASIVLYFVTPVP